MEDLNKITLDSLDRYFTVLESLGYTNESNTNKLILLLFLQEFLQEYSYYITEENYTTIEKIVQCLSLNSCLIPYREYQQLSTPLIGYIYSIPIRITLNSIIRHTEIQDSLRLVNL